LMKAPQLRSAGLVAGDLGEGTGASNIAMAGETGHANDDLETKDYRP
jgi:hypothetical protein